MRLSKLFSETNITRFRLVDTLVACAMTLLLLMTTTAQAEDVVKWVDEKGHVHFGDKPPPSSTVETEVIQLKEAPKLGLTEEELAQQKRKTQAYKRGLESKNRAEKSQGRQENSEPTIQKNNNYTKTREDCRNEHPSRTADRVRCFRSIDRERR